MTSITLSAQVEKKKTREGFGRALVDLGEQDPRIVVLVGDLTESKLKEAHALGITVVVWTVNEATQIGKLLDLGVDGIISDRPDVVRQVLGKRGLALPHATPVTP